MSGRVVLLLRARQGWEPREWPRRRQGALRDEKVWLESLSDREMAGLCAELHAVDRAVKNFKAKKDAA